MRYTDYIGNTTRFAVELVNSGGADRLGPESAGMFAEHGVEVPRGPEFDQLLAVIREALEQIVDGYHPAAVSTLLATYPPQLELSHHDAAEAPHIHFAPDGSPPVDWVGKVVGATLAYVATGDSGLTLGRCAAPGCGNLFVDQSRNRTRRFCGNTCASRTSVAAYRARSHG